MNPFDAIGEEVEISESDEHLFAPASSSSSTEPNYSHTDQGKNTSQTANQASRYTPAPSAVSTDYPSHSHLPPQPQTTASPFGSPRNTSPSPYAPPQSQSARASPYGVSYSNTAASVQRPGSSILRKQVDAYDPPMPPPSRPITRNKSSLLLHQQQQPHAHSRPNSPYTPYNPSSQTMPPPPRRDSGQSSTNQADDSYNQRPYSPPIHARPASRGSQARSSLAQSQGQPAYQPVSRPSSRGATFNAYAPPPRAPSLPPGPPPATSSPYAPPPPRQQVPQSAPANQTQYAPNQYSQLPATSTPRSAQSPPLSNQYSPPAQPVYQQILHESPPSHRDHEPTTPNLSIHPASPAKPIHPPLPQSISATLAQTTPPMQQEGFGTSLASCSNHTLAHFSYSLFPQLGFQSSR